MAVYTRVSFRFVGPAIDPGTISDALGLQPSSAGRKGEVRHGREGRRYTNQTNFWLLDSLTGEEANPEEQIASLLSILEPRAGALVDLIAAGHLPEFSRGVFLDWLDGQFTLGASTLARAGVL